MSASNSHRSGRIALFVIRLVANVIAAIMVAGTYSGAAALAVFVALSYLGDIADKEC